MAVQAFTVTPTASRGFGRYASPRMSAVPIMCRGLSFLRVALYGCGVRRHGNCRQDAPAPGYMLRWPCPVLLHRGQRPTLVGHASLGWYAERLALTGWLAPAGFRRVRPWPAGDSSSVNDRSGSVWCTLLWRQACALSCGHSDRLSFCPSPGTMAPASAVGSVAMWCSAPFQPNSL
jgi:hypothetical protein